MAKKNKTGKEKFDKTKFFGRILALILAAFMVLSVAATLIFYLAQ